MIFVLFLSIIQAFADMTDGFPFDKVQYAVKSSVSMATLAKSRLLTQECSVKKTIELEFDIQVCATAGCLRYMYNVGCLQCTCTSL